MDGVSNATSDGPGKLVMRVTDCGVDLNLIFSQLMQSLRHI